MKTRILIFPFQVIQFKQTFKSFKGRRPPTQLSGPANACYPPSGPHEPWPVHAPTDGGERAAGAAHAALVTRALH